MCSSMQLLTIYQVSAWTWAATLLQSSTVAYTYGVAGPFWVGFILKERSLAHISKVCSWCHCSDLDVCPLSQGA